MDPTILLTTCLVGIVGLYLALRPGRPPVRAGGGMLFVASMTWLVVSATGAASPDVFFTGFSVIAIAAALRMITHHRPVYSALYFIIVVIASAALFLLMHAEFMAFALVIVYAGAILVTYVFVLMLAQQQTESSGQASYDLVAREPAAAALVGFVMIGLLSSLFLRSDGLPIEPDLAEARRVMWQEQLEALPRRLEREVMAIEPDFNWPPVADENGYRVMVDAAGGAAVMGTVGDAADLVRVELPLSALPENVQQVGHALVARFPVSLELAGVILLLAMFGAVVLARKQIELGEDEVRDAAGLPRFGFEDDHGEGA